MDQHITTLLNNARNAVPPVITDEQLGQLTDDDVDMLHEVDNEGMARFVFRRFVETPEQREERIQAGIQELAVLRDELRRQQEDRADAVVEARAEQADLINIANGPADRNPTPSTGGRKRSRKRARKNRPTKKSRR
jgi:hypothetical protein